jgi:hypothetical protein
MYIKDNCFYRLVLFTAWRNPNLCIYKKEIGIETDMEYSLCTPEEDENQDSR